MGFYHRRKIEKFGNEVAYVMVKKKLQSFLIHNSCHPTTSKHGPNKASFWHFNTQQCGGWEKFCIWCVLYGYNVNCQELWVKIRSLKHYLIDRIPSFIECLHDYNWPRGPNKHQFMLCLPLARQDRNVTVTPFYLPENSSVSKARSKGATDAPEISQSIRCTSSVIGHHNHSFMF